jgi:hypothetical protein
MREILELQEMLEMLETLEDKELPEMVATPAVAVMVEEEEVLDLPDLLVLAEILDPPQVQMD